MTRPVRISIAAVLCGIAAALIAAAAWGFVPFDNVDWALTGFALFVLSFAFREG